MVKPLSRKVGWLTRAAVAGLLAVDGAAQAQLNEGQSAVASGLQDDDGAEIVVTARKREERLIDVPIAVSAYSGDDLARQGVEDVVDLFGRTPNLYLTTNPLSPASDLAFLVIRGIGANSQLEPSVATFVDGVYMPSLGFDIDFLELERVEVLRGPQSTLFGRNAEAGALNIVTRLPGPTPRRIARLEVDDRMSVKAASSLSGPIADNVYAEVAGQFRWTDGYAENSRLGESADRSRSYTVRGTLRAEATETVEAILRADASFRRGRAALPGFPRGCECYSLTSELRSRQAGDNWGISLQVDADLGGVDLTSISAVRKVTSDVRFDFDGSDQFIDNVHEFAQRQRIVSQELRLTSASPSPFQWLVGGYLFFERQISDRAYTLEDLDTFYDGIFNRQLIDTERRGFALFGQATYTIGDRLDLSGGLRYSSERVEGSAAVDFDIPLIGFVDSFVVESAQTYDDVAPSLSLTMRWSPRLTTYATISRGFKSGGLDRAPASREAARLVAPESSTNYELGVKANLMNGGLAFDLALFQVDLEDQQLQTVRIVDGIPFSAIANAGQSRTRGIEATLTLRPVEGLTLAGSVGYTDTEIEEYVDGAGIDRAGEDFPYVPAWTASGQAEYVTPLTPLLDLRLLGSLRYVDNYFVGGDVPFNPRFDIDSYAVVDAAIGVETPDWALALFADNLFDNYAVTNVWNAFFFADDRINLDQPIAPRRIGLRARISF